MSLCDAHEGEVVLDVQVDHASGLAFGDEPRHVVYDRPGLAVGEQAGAVPVHGVDREGPALRRLFLSVVDIRPLSLEAGELLFRDAKVAHAAVEVEYPGSHGAAPFFGVIGRWKRRPGPAPEAAYVSSG